MAQADSYEEPEPENRELINTFGMEVELTTFKSNVKESTVKSQDPEDEKIFRPEVRRNPAIICAGNYSNNWDKIVYIKHYMQERPDSHRTVGVDWASKELRLAANEAVRVLFVLIGDHVFDRIIKAFLNHMSSTTEIIGVLVFWGPKIPSSLNSAVDWRRRIQKVLPKEKRDLIPFLLITDNISSVKWIGNGKIMENEASMDTFCKENGFIEWFQILKSNWRLGNQNDIGRAIDYLLKQTLDKSDTLKY